MLIVFCHQQQVAIGGCDLRIEGLHGILELSLRLRIEHPGGISSLVMHVSNELVHGIHGGHPESIVVHGSLASDLRGHFSHLVEFLTSPLDLLQEFVGFLGSCFPWLPLKGSGLQDFHGVAEFIHTVYRLEELLVLVNTPAFQRRVDVSSHVELSQRSLVHRYLAHEVRDGLKQRLRRRIGQMRNVLADSSKDWAELIHVPKELIRRREEVRPCELIVHLGQLRTDQIKSHVVAFEDGLGQISYRCTGAVHHGSANEHGVDRVQLLRIQIGVVFRVVGLTLSPLQNQRTAAWAQCCGCIFCSLEPHDIRQRLEGVVAHV